MPQQPIFTPPPIGKPISFDPPPVGQAIQFDQPPTQPPQPVGAGTRIASIRPDLPTPTIPIGQMAATGGRTILSASDALSYPLRDPQGFAQMVLSMPEDLFKAHGQAAQSGIDAIKQGKPIEGAARLLVSAIPALGPMFIQYADAPDQATREQIAGNGIAAIMSSKLPEAVSGTRNAVITGRNSTAAHLMQSALKPGVEAAMDTTAAGVPKVVQTMLTEGATVSPGGVKKLYTLLGDTAKAIDAKTANAPGNISPMAVVDHALDLTKNFANQVNSAQDLKSIADAANQFLDEQMAKNGRGSFGGQIHGPMSVADAQAMKSGTYKALGAKSYGELKGASIEGQKALASGLKDQIEQLVPDVKGDNQRYGAISDALEATARRVGVSGNKDLGGIFWIAHNPEAFLAAQFDRSPMVKSLLARGLYTEAAKASGVPAPLMKLAVTALVSAPEAMKPVPSHEVKR